MSYVVSDIIAALPPLQGNRDVIIPGEQSVKDIMAEVLESHKVFSTDYDSIAEYFVTDADPLRSLFKFCRDHLPYVAEDEKDQTSRSPIAIMMLADKWGVDCKHYAGWIAGVIDACNRAGYTTYDWCYRFASYNPFNPTKEHVFIVINPGTDEIWIDPAPIINDDGSYTQRSFNDRKVIPMYSTDKKPNMSLNRISGINGCCSSINPRYQAMGYISLWQPMGDDNYYPMFDNPWDIFSGSLNQQLYPSTAIDYPVDPVDTQYTPEPVLSDTGGSYLLAPEHTLTRSWDLIDFGPSVLYDPVLAQIDPATTDLNRIESTTFPVITDYPTVTGEPIISLPLTTTTATTTSTTTDTGLKTGFDFMTFVKANPVETILIGSAVVVGGIYLLKRKKRKR